MEQDAKLLRLVSQFDNAATRISVASPRAGGSCTCCCCCCMIGAISVTAATSQMNIAMQKAHDLEESQRIKKRRNILRGIFPFILIGEFFGWFYGTFLGLYYVTMYLASFWPVTLIIIIGTIVTIKRREKRVISELEHTRIPSTATVSSPIDRLAESQEREASTHRFSQPESNPAPMVEAKKVITQEMDNLEAQASVCLAANNSVEYLRTLAKIKALALETYDMDKVKAVQARIDEFKGKS
nr:hypothetical protein [Candidatus Sigynarchaeota archaeon]